MTAVEHPKNKQPAFKESATVATTALSPNSKAVLFCLFQLALCMVLAFALFDDPQERNLDIESAGVKCNEHNQDVQNDYLRQAKTTSSAASPKKKDDVSVSMIVIASDKRSAATFLSNEILVQMPCHISLEEAFNEQGEFWQLDAREMGYGLAPEHMDPDQLATYVTTLAQNRCRDHFKKGTMDAKQCNNHCWVNYKHYPNHLGAWQHSLLWNGIKERVSSFAMLILERNVMDRWRSLWYHQTYQDPPEWGIEDHKQAVNAVRPDRQPGHFAYDQTAWFQLVRGYANVQAAGSPVLDIDYEDLIDTPVPDVQKFIQENVVEHPSSRNVPVHLKPVQVHDTGKAMQEDW